MADIIYFVIPCFNEEQALPRTAALVAQKLEGWMAQGCAAPESRVLLVNDGSSDGTWALIQQLHRQQPHLFSGVNLSCNRGHQNALLAGLSVAGERADAAISMDADLQDDLDAADRMLAQYYQGSDIVYGVRDDRSSDGFFKRFTAEGFYRVMHWLGARTIFNHADYRLMSRRAIQGLLQFGEVNLFLRGLVPMVGYPSSQVTYRRGVRVAGESKYPLPKMLAFAMEGITSMSTRPIRLISALGFGVFMVSMGMLCYILWRYFTGHTVVGWASVAISVWAIGGLQLLAMGVIGEYVGKVYLEAKHRPRFLIEQVLESPAPPQP